MRNTVLFQCSKIFFVIYYTWGIPKMVVIIFLICCFLLLCCDKNQLLYYKNIFYVHSLDVPTVQVQQPSYSVTTGNSVTLVCTVSSSLPITSVQWQRNVNGGITTINSNTNTNKYSGSTTTTPSLTIFSAASSDVGTYTCFATNSVGTGQSTTTTLSVTGSKYQ